MSQRFLAKFFAVTLGRNGASIFEVRSERDERGNPLVTKIGLRGESSIPVGGRLVPHGADATHIGISRAPGLLLYCAPRSDRPASPVPKPQVPGFARAGGIVALFLTETEARACLNDTLLKEEDPRWEKATRQTLRAIGCHHPVFVVPDEPDLALKGTPGTSTFSRIWYYKILPLFDRASS